MTKSKRLKKFLIAISVLLFCLALLPFICDKIISHSTETRIYDNSDELPEKHCGLLLGTSKYLRDGITLNPYYENRILAAAELMNKGKIKFLVISGDNSVKSYNEPEDMKRDLMALGIDSQKIFLDYAGFRTFDSVVRMNKIFGQDNFCVISQAFHNERAVYIAALEGVEAVGFNARDVGKAFGFKVMLREKFARVKLFIDYVLFVEPRFLGPAVHIPA